MGIPPHFDVHPPFEEYFVSISLLSGLVMTFKSFKNEEQHLYLPPRSCALLTGEVRYAWFHSIASRKMDRVEGEMSFRRRRISLTFRTIRKDLQCKCPYPFFCQS
jgi:alkylated DNA repair protein alkB family protein 8